MIFKRTSEPLKFIDTLGKCYLDYDGSWYPESW